MFRNNKPAPSYVPVADWHRGNMRIRNKEIPFSAVRLGLIRDDDFSAGILVIHIIRNIGHSRSSLEDLS